MHIYECLFFHSRSNHEKKDKSIEASFQKEFDFYGKQCSSGTFNDVVKDQVSKKNVESMEMAAEQSESAISSIPQLDGMNDTAKVRENVEVG